MSYEEAISAIKQYVAEREWGQFHSPENLAQSICIEAGELLENFQWQAEPNYGDVADELADVLTYAYLLADGLGVDPNKLVADKVAVTRKKYPVQKARGRSTKYDRL